MINLQNYIEYISSAIKIFMLTFIIGKGINKLFEKIEKDYPNYNKKILGFTHLFFIINVAYYLHIFTSDEFSDEFQISHPGILFSSFMINLQSNMFKNLGILD